MAVIALKKDAALALGISERNLGNWQNLPGFPEYAGGYDIEAIKVWREQQQRKGNEAEKQLSTIRAAIALETLKDKKGRNELRSMAIAEKQGELVPRQTVHDLLMELAGLIRSAGKDLQRSGNLKGAQALHDLTERFGHIIHDRLSETKADVDGGV